MASIRYKHLRLVVYPNDHPPPHCHVLGPGWEMTIAGRPKTAEMADALMAVAQQLSALRTNWSD